MPAGTADASATGAFSNLRADRAHGMQLAELVKGWRYRLRADQIPGLVTDHRSRKNAGNRVSQEDMGYLTGYTAMWFGSLERGRLDRNYSEEFLDRVAYALRLNSTEREALYRLAIGRVPTSREHTAPEISHAERMLLEAQPWPAWYTDPGWELLAKNASALRWFPHMTWETNVMRWTFVYPQSQLQLMNWQIDWAPPMLFQMRAAIARWPAHEGLRRTISECLEASDFARTLWEADPKIVDNPDGHHRRLLIPGSRDATEVEIVAQTPMRNPAVRMVAVIPAGGCIPDECKLKAGSLLTPEALAGDGGSRP